MRGREGREKKSFLPLLLLRSSFLRSLIVYELPLGPSKWKFAIRLICQLTIEKKNVLSLPPFTVEFLRYRMCENHSFKRLHKMDLSKKGSNAL